MFRNLSVIAVLVVVLSACASSPAVTEVDIAPTRDAPTLPIIAAPVRDLRGAIVNSEIVDRVGAPIAKTGAKQYKIIYHSVSGMDGSEREVSGTVFVPSGQPPVGGWPVIAYGHGLTGITSDCGPSQYRDLLGYDLVVASLIELGFAVTLTDYEGLGHPGVHPFLVPATAAFDMIDSVRAARRLTPDISSRWFAVGVSQGGQASWAANELAGEYGDGLEFMGSASLSPAVDLTGLPALADSGWLTKSQQVLLPTLIYGLQTTHPDLNPGNYLHGSLARDTDMWLACTGELAQKRSTAVGALTAANTTPATPSATAALKDALAEYALPQRRASGPMLVITGSDDETIREAWVAGAVRKACAMDDVVEFIVRPGEGHTDLNGGPRVAQWLGERLSGAPAVNTCGAM
jgi:hypothetical protein